MPKAHIRVEGDITFATNANQIEQSIRTALASHGTVRRLSVSVREVGNFPGENA